jgi:hypothetical protein
VYDGIEWDEEHPEPTTRLFNLIESVNDDARVIL